MIYFVLKMSLSVCLVETWHTLGVVCCASTSEVVRVFQSFDTLLENWFDWQRLLEFEYIGMWSFGCLLASNIHGGHTAGG